MWSSCHVLKKKLFFSFNRTVMLKTNLTLFNNLQHILKVIMYVCRISLIQFSLIFSYCSVIENVIAIHHGMFNIKNGVYSIVSLFTRTFERIVIHYYLLVKIVCDVLLFWWYYTISSTMKLICIFELHWNVFCAEYEL